MDKLEKIYAAGGRAVEIGPCIGTDEMRKIARETWPKLNGPRRHIEYMADAYDELLARLKLVGRIAERDETLSLFAEAPRPHNSEILVCWCGWHGTYEEQDALGSKVGCCPKCGYEDLLWLHEMAEQLMGKP
jgi:hypothetical protein